MEIYVQKDGQQRGPFPELRIRQGIDAGEFAPADLAWTTGKASWQPLSALINLDVDRPPPIADVISTSAQREPFDNSSTVVQTEYSEPPVISANSAVLNTTLHKFWDRKRKRVLRDIGVVVVVSTIGIALSLLVQQFIFHNSTTAPAWTGAALSLVAGFVVLALTSPNASLGYLSNISFAIGSMGVIAGIFLGFDPGVWPFQSMGVTMLAMLFGFAVSKLLGPTKAGEVEVVDKSQLCTNRHEAKWQMDTTGLYFLIALAICWLSFKAWMHLEMDDYPTKRALDLYRNDGSSGGNNYSKLNKEAAPRKGDALPLDKPFVMQSILGSNNRPANDNTTSQYTSKVPGVGLRKSENSFIAAFGPPYAKSASELPPADYEENFNDEDLTYLVTFWHGMDHHVAVSRKDGRGLSEDDIRRTLDTFSDGATWIPEPLAYFNGQRGWHRDAVSAWIVENQSSGPRPDLVVNYMQITTDEFWQTYVGNDTTN